MGVRVKRYYFGSLRCCVVIQSVPLSGCAFYELLVFGEFTAEVSFVEVVEAITVAMLAPHTDSCHTANPALCPPLEC